MGESLRGFISYLLSRLYEWPPAELLLFLSFILRQSNLQRLEGKNKGSRRSYS
jgi:hypothetical protein